jgi:hypothetical protein
MGVEKLYKDSIDNIKSPIKGELHLDGEDFEYEYFLLPIVGPNKSEIEQMLISRLGNRVQNGKKCLDIDEELVTTNLENDEYTSVVFIKNKNHDDVASGTMQYYDWCESGKSGGKPQIWVNDLCRIATQKRSVSPVKALLIVFEMIAIKYVKGIRYIHLMVDKENPAEADVLTKIYSKYGYSVVDITDCEVEGDEFILMKKKIDRKSAKSSVKSRKPRKSKTLKASRTPETLLSDPILKMPSPLQKSKSKTISPLTLSR